MARKKLKPDGERPKRRAKPAAAVPDLPDPRSVEGILRRFVGASGSGSDKDSPSSGAEALLAQAYRAKDRQRCAELANEALAAWPDCADAYVVLAEQAPRRKEALGLYEKGVAAGERAIGAEGFRRNVGHFWLALETRPYMRARLGLAHVLWTLGRRDEAVRHLQDLLRLNPGDNQGVRYTLAGFLLFLDRDDELDQLLAQYPDEASAAWAYTRALLAFRRQGDVIESRRLLKAARKSNKHVPAYLLGQKFPPSRQPSYYRPGDVSEALEYIGSFMAGWKSTPGAAAWLRANAASGKKRPETPEPKGPLAAVKTWLNKRLPQKDDVWQADFRRLSNWITTDGGAVRPWLVLVTNQSKGLMLANEVSDREPSPELLWDVLVQAMQHPAMGSPHRPAELRVRPGQPWESLRSPIEEIGVRLNATEEPAETAAALADLSEHLAGKAEPGLLDAPGVTPGQVAGFYEAAAAFFRRAPWKKVGYESAIRVECDKFTGGPWYAVLMGQSGLTIGMALYDDLETLKRLWTRGGDDEENARETVGVSVTFGEETDIPVADLEASERHGWLVARADAYPSVFRKERGLSRRPPLAWELELLEACLRAIPDFVERRWQDDPTREEATVATASGELTLGLSWVVDW